MNFKTTLPTLFIFIFIFINNCTTANSEIETPSNDETQPSSNAEEGETLIIDSAPKEFENDEIQLIINAQQEDLEKLKTEIKLLKESVNDV